MFATERLQQLQLQYNGSRRRLTTRALHGESQGWSVSTASAPRLQWWGQQVFDSHLQAETQVAVFAGFLTLWGFGNHKP